MNKDKLISLIDLLTSALDLEVNLESLTRDQALNMLPDLVENIVSDHHSLVEKLTQAQDEVLSLKEQLENSQGVDDQEVLENTSSTLVDDFCAFMGITTRVSPLWQDLQLLNPRGDQWETCFSREFYDQNTQECYAFMGKLKAKAAKQGLQARFRQGRLYLQKIQPKDI